VKTLKSRFFIGLALFITAAILVMAGIYHDEVRDVISNATILCYSCIGIK
jgi:hypothetical protein